MRSRLLLAIIPCATALDAIGFGRRDTDCAGCEIVARSARDATALNPAKLRKDGPARLEIIEELCRSLDYVYPRSVDVDARKVLRFDPLDSDEVPDPNKTKIAALESAKHVADLPEKIVRGTEPNIALREHCQELLEEHDDALSEAIRVAAAYSDEAFSDEADAVFSSFCMRTAKACSAKQLADIDEASKPQVKMPEGMRKEDWTPAMKETMRRQMTQMNDNLEKNKERERRKKAQKKKKKKMARAKEEL